MYLLVVPVGGSPLYLSILGPPDPNVIDGIMDVTRDGRRTER